MAVKVGEKAPDFKLYNTEKQEINLSDYRGKNVVILFFPLAFTSVCTVEMKSVCADLSSYNDLQAAVLGISVDSLFTLERFKAEQDLTIELLSDFNKTTATDYDALYEDFVLGMKGVAKRASFVVDKEGIIRYAEVLDSAGDLPNFDAIKDALTQLN